MNIIKRTINFVTDTLETIVFIGSLYIVVYLFLFFPSSVHGASMEPTLHTDDRIIVSRIAYKLDSFNRGDIIVLRSPQNPDIDYIKRVIGLPNDNILIKEGHVYVNQQPLKESYINVSTNTWESGFIKEGVPYIVPSGYLFVMGDNRPRSSDSREFGPIPFDSVVGKAVFRYYPAGTIKGL